MKRIIALLLSLASTLLAAWAAGDQLNVHETSGLVTSFNASNVDSISFVQGSEQLQKYVLHVPNWYLVFAGSGTMSLQGTFQPVQGSSYEITGDYYEEFYNTAFSVYARPSDTFHFEKDGTALQVWDYDQSAWVDAEWTFGYYPYIIVNLNERPFKWTGDWQITMSVKGVHDGVYDDLPCHVGDVAKLFIDAPSLGESITFLRNAQISSSNPAVAVVDDKKLVRCLGVGTTTITATAFGETFSVELKVEEETLNTDVEELNVTMSDFGYGYAGIAIESNTAVKAQVTGSLDGIRSYVSIYKNGSDYGTSRSWEANVDQILVSFETLDNQNALPNDVKVRIETIHGLVKEIPVVLGQNRPTWVETRERYGSTTSAWQDATDQIGAYVEGGEDILISIPFSTNEAGSDGRWQAQVFFKSTTPIPMEAGKNYKWTVNVHSNKAGVFYSKVLCSGPDCNMAYNNLEMSKQLVAGDNSFTMVVAATEHTDDVDFHFALGGNEANMVYTIQMSLVETTDPADEIVIPDLDPDTEFVDVSDIDMSQAAATWSVLSAKASWGDWTLSEDNVATTVNGSTITYQVNSTTAGNIWYAQLFIGSGVSVAANQAFKVSFDIVADQECTVLAIMFAGDWVDGAEAYPQASELAQVTVSNTSKHVELASRGGAAIGSLRVTMGLGGCPYGTIYTISNLKVELGD